MDGEATADDLATLRPHIRTCLSCRAALREYRSAPATAAALVPAAAFAVSHSPGFLDLPARAAEVVAGWAQKAQTATEMASAQKVAAVAASTAVLGGGAVITVENTDIRHDRPESRSHAARERAGPAQPPRPAPASVPAPPVVTTPPAPRLSEAERVEREAKRKTPPAQQEFEPAWAADEPAPTTSTTATASTSASEPAPAPTPTGSGGGAQEFAP